MKNTAHAPEKPEELQYMTRPDGLADVWIRKNIVQQPCPSDSGEGENLEYVYEEAFFRTSTQKEDIEKKLDAFWEEAAVWKPETPLTPEEKREKEIAELRQSQEQANKVLESNKKTIESLKKDLKQAKESLETAKTDNDMAITELTMIMAAIMEQNEKEDEEDV